MPGAQWAQGPLSPSTSGPPPLGAPASESLGPRAPQLEGSPHVEKIWLSADFSSPPQAPRQISIRFQLSSPGPPPNFHRFEPSSPPRQISTTDSQGETGGGRSRSPWRMGPEPRRVPQFFFDVVDVGQRVPQSGPLAPRNFEVDQGPILRDPST